jgi:hypothetical protein
VTALPLRRRRTAASRSRGSVVLWLRTAPATRTGQRPELALPRL